MRLKTVSLSLKVFVLYVHREYSTHEIALMLGKSRQLITQLLKMAEKSSPQLAVMIRKQKKLNMLNSQYKSMENKLRGK